MQQKLYFLHSDPRFGSEGFWILGFVQERTTLKRPLTNGAEPWSGYEMGSWDRIVLTKWNCEQSLQIHICIIIYIRVFSFLYVVSYLFVYIILYTYMNLYLYKYISIYIYIYICIIFVVHGCMALDFATAWTRACARSSLTMDSKTCIYCIYCDLSGHILVWDTFLRIMSSYVNSVWMALLYFIHFYIVVFYNDKISTGKYLLFQPSIFCGARL